MHAGLFLSGESFYLPQEAFEQDLQHVGQPEQHVTPQQPFGQHPSFAQQETHDELAVAAGFGAEGTMDKTENVIAAIRFNITDLILER